MTIPIVTETPKQPKIQFDPNSIEEGKHMTALKVSEKEEQPTMKIVPNKVETTKQSKIQFDSDFIKEGKHVSNAYLPCISIKPLKDNKYFCGICNVESSGEVDLKGHVKGLRHRTAQTVYGCNNISVQENSKYYCGCCDHLLANRQLAFDHIKEEKHMNNSNLPCISIELLDIDKYVCRICNINISSKINLDNHVNGRRHTAAQNHYGCSNITLNEENQYYCAWCDCTLKSRRLAFAHTKIEKHISNALLPCISIKPLKDNKYFCRICNVESSGEVDLKAHVKGCRHREAQMVYGCNNISVQENSKYYCGCCDHLLANRQLAFDHIKEEKHMNNSNLPCISIELLDTDNYVCRICNVIISSKINLDNHVNGRRHTAAQNHYGCSNITLNEENQYYCAWCDCTLKSRRLAFEHTKIEKHMSNAHLPCISIKPLKDNKYFCRICNVESSGEVDLKAHVKGFRHREAQTVYGCNNISLQENSKYYCGCCDHLLANRQLAFDHIKEEKHMSNANLPCISIKLLDIDNYVCSICNINISSKTVLDNHVNGRRHTAAQDHYGCSSITHNEDNQYYCGWCNCTLKSRRLAFEHIKIEEHMSNAHLPCISIKLLDIDKYVCRICNSNISGKIDLDNHVNGRRHMSAQNDYGCTNITLKEDNLYYCGWCDCTLESRTLAFNHIEEKHMRNVEFPCISIMPLENKKYFCGICDVECSSKIDLQMHVKGFQHKASQRKYGCNNIVLEGVNVYYCRCCNFILSSREVAFQHIKERKHIIAVNVSDEEEQSTIKTIPIVTETTKQPDIQFASDSIKKEKNMTVLKVSEKEEQPTMEMVSNVVETTKQPKVQVAFDSIKEGQYMSNVDLPCISIMRVAVNSYHCRICDVYPSNQSVLESHVNGKPHKEAQKKYGCEQISLKSGNLYYCGWCDRTLKSRRLASEHIKLEKHMTNAHLPCISIKIVNVNKYHCRICHIDNLSRTDLDIHVSGTRHTKAQKKFGCNDIVRKRGDLYHCRCCDLTLSSRRIAFRHIQQEQHISAMKSTDKEDQPTTKQIPKIAESINEPKSISEPISENMSCSYVFKENTTDSYCAVCDCIIPGETNVEVHTKGNQHITALKVFSNNKISPKERICYYCEYCSCIISGFKNVREHMAGKRHAIKMPINETGAATQKPQESKSIAVKPETKVGENLHCRVCNTDITKWKDHIMENRHKIGSQKFYENKILFQSNSYHCLICDCKLPSYQHIDDHIKGQPHICCLYVNKVIRETEEPASQSSSVSSKLINPKKQFPKVKRREIKNFQTRRSKKFRVTHKISAEKGEMHCSVCNASVKGESNLHIHLAQHFANDFIISNNDEKSVEQTEVTKTKTTSQFEPTEDIDCKEKVVKRVKRTTNMKKILIDLDFDADYIYSMEDKSADIKSGMQLCYPINEKYAYCFVCQTEVEISMQDYYQHLITSDHCEYLDEMEKDHTLFEPFPDQFSELDLARHYMIETEDDFVYCFICDVELDNIEQHIHDRNHNEQCVQLHIKANENFENVKLKRCDWYEIQFYWCVPCMISYQSEVNFAKHLKSPVHINCMKEKSNTTRKLIFDFCTSCALLWYGYRCTSAYHGNVPTHMWLKQDGHYSLTEIPESAKRLLANPEDFVNKIIKHFDDMFAKEQAKEATVIMHIEKAVKCKFLNAKAYTFGSRVSGLGSPDSDIDVFLDCGNMYDGEASSMDRILKYMTDVQECLSQEPHLWVVKELLTTCRSPIIRAYHKVTGLSCDIAFENGLAVENTLLIKSFNDKFPSCRKLILIVKEWFKLCELLGSERITSYAMYWHVIFYLQKESLLPSIASLIEMKNESHKISGWEVGVNRDFTCNALEHDFSIKELLIGFFEFYANFDYRYEVACPLLSKVLAKRAFATPESLPEEMRPYKAYVKTSNEAFRIDSVMCIQDPFDLQHNLTKAVGKVYLNRFRKYCLKSLEILMSVHNAQSILNGH